MTTALAQVGTALAGRYEIDSQIGHGGMATVYLARDVRHARRVAIKVVRDDLSASLGADRFLAEIRTTAALQHPHILPLLDSGEAAGRLYYVMPYVDGETLRACLDRQAALSVPEAIRLTVQIASALDHAHRRGIVHRDIKPENILLADGLPIVADFGIALAVQQAGGDRLTYAGMSLGTPDYMSPEQVVGARDVDARSDQYSLACMLYEMIAGRVPYRGATPHGTMIEHVTAPVPPVTSPRATVPPALVSALLRAMAKEPGERFATVADFAAALQAVALAAVERPLTHDRSIVVLPFKNLSPDPNDAFFADGLTEEITSDLSRIHALRVISRTSAIRYKNTDKDIPTIAREVNVHYVLEGTVRRAASSLRVTAQLIDAATDAHVWSEKFSGTMDDVFEIQERLAREIVSALRVTLTPDESRRVGTPRVKDPLAYDCYIRARQLMYSGTAETFAAAGVMLERAVELSGENALLLATSAFRHSMLAQTAMDSDQANFDRALALADRALALDADCVVAHATRGIVFKSRGDFARGSEAFRQALAVEPNHADALGWLIFMTAEAGRNAEAHALAARLFESNPLDPYSYMWRGAAEFFDGRFTDALTTFDAFGRADPNARWSEAWRAWTLMMLGRDDELRASLPRLENVLGPEIDAAHRWILKCRLDGSSALLEGLSPNAIAALRNDTEFSWIVASSFAAVGQRERAVEWLRGSVRLGLKSHPFLTRHDRALASLQGYPPYDALMREVEAEWKALQR